MLGDGLQQLNIHTYNTICVPFLYIQSKEQYAECSTL